VGYRLLRERRANSHLVSSAGNPYTALADIGVVGLTAQSLTNWERLLRLYTEFRRPYVLMS